MAANGSPKRGLILGAGGDTGFQWAIATLDALEKHLGWDAREADMFVGTSAGALISALLAQGISVSDLVAWRTKQLPEDHPLRSKPEAPTPSEKGSRLPADPLLALRALTGAVPVTAALTGMLPRGTHSLDIWLAPLAAHSNPGEWVNHPKTWIVAVDCENGKPVAFGSPGAPKCGIVDAVRASGSVPSVFTPVLIEGRKYMDGAVASSTSAHLALDQGLDEVIVVAPMAAAGRPTYSDFLLRQRMRFLLGNEVKKLRDAGVTVRVLTPTSAELDALGANALDVKRARAAFPLIMETAPGNVAATFR
ncbi:patatin-like phospholipase family protein [Smaragdicoccus niigatensis]|uniref:patatin-like phospholipase family protein n=1 Tax=Smaragdicoccus niigatensis TaxID=359359 RepID=UPI00036B8545|nr:patatin-like phospholipase family protein [Smaragdicoccus niigatensis]